MFCRSQLIGLLLACARITAAAAAAVGVCAAAAAAAGPHLAVHCVPADQLQLQLCIDAKQGLPLMPGHLNPALMMSLPPILAMEKAVFQTPSGSKEVSEHTQQQQQNWQVKAKDARQARSAEGGAGLSSTAGGTSRDSTLEWKLRLLQKGVDWSNQQHRQLLQQLLLKATDGPEPCSANGG